MTIFADFNLTFAPVRPWEGLRVSPRVAELLALLGSAAFIVAALLLIGLTVLTYAVVRRASWKRTLVVLLLRLAVLLVCFLMMLRPRMAFTQLEGVEGSKLLVVVDGSASMSVAEVEGKPTRWQQVDALWNSPRVQRRLRQLAADEKVEVVKYLGAADLRPEEKDTLPDGPRTDIGAWLEQLFSKHGHDKHVRAVALFSDGADNGTRFSTLEKARRWRGIAPIHAFAAGDPNNTRFKKDLGLSKLDIKPERIYVKTPMKLDAIVQAPGFLNTEFEGAVWIQHVDAKEATKLKDIPRFKIASEKDQKLRIDAEAPEKEGEYKVTVDIKAHPDETNQENNKISTYVQVMKEKINILWVDRPRVYEPVQIIQLALAPEARLKVHYVELKPGDAKDRALLYELNQRHYDLIVIGDISAKQFSLGNGKLFERIHAMVETEKTGLLMLGGSETFSKGGWDQYPAFMNLLPVDFNLKDKKFDFGPETVNPVRAMPTAEGLKEEFARLDRDPKANTEIWSEAFFPLKDVAPVGTVLKTSREVLRGANNEPVLIVTRTGAGRVAIFTADSTAEVWLGSEKAAKGFIHFWKHLVYWTASQEDRDTPLVVTLDRRRIATGGADVLGFTMVLRDKAGKALPDAQFKAEIVGPKEKHPVRIASDRGTFQGAKEPGEYKLVVEGWSKDKSVTGNATARFVAAHDDIETLRPLAEHETLSRIAAAAEGRFHPAQEEAFLVFLDELAGQVNRESRHKTTHWPDWTRVPPSESMRDQLAGIWHSFALVSMLLFVCLLGGEWLLRRMWGMV